MHKLAMATATALALCWTAGSAQAATMNYSATLSAASEVPPNNATGTGSVTATLDTATRELSWTVNYSGLTGPAAAAHFHCPAPAGKNAGVAVPLKGSLTAPIKGSAELTAAQLKEFEDGQCYFNIHTAANKGGELRGQMEKAK